MSTPQTPAPKAKPKWRYRIGLFLALSGIIMIISYLHEQNQIKEEKENREWIAGGCWVYKKICKTDHDQSSCHFRSESKIPFLLDNRLITPFQVCKFDTPPVIGKNDAKQI